MNANSAFAAIDVTRLDWRKGDGLLPAIVQHADDSRVLMLGFMNAEALQATQTTGQVTFWSRTRQRLWTKGESSGHVLDLVGIAMDCDRDTLLVSARPRGPVCHLGTPTCFDVAFASPTAFLIQLDALVAERHAQRPPGSYTTRLFDAGIARMAQKVGEEGVETALAAVVDEGQGLLDEAADLTFHLLVLLRARGLGLADLAARLAQRHGSKPAGDPPTD